MPRTVRAFPDIPEAEVVAMAIFDPAGAQYLAVSLVGTPVEAIYTRDQVEQLKEKIAAFERAALFEDARPIERVRRHREPL